MIDLTRLTESISGLSRPFAKDTALPMCAHQTLRSFTRPSQRKVELANSCRQTQVGVCQRNKNSSQTRWQTNRDK